MREVTIRFLGPIRKPKDLGAIARLSVEEDQTVEALLTTLGYQELERGRLRVMVGGRTLGRHDPLGEIDELTVFLPLGGG